MKAVRWCLAVYPRSFRERFGEEWLAVAEYRWRTRSRTAPGTLGSVLILLRDTVKGAVSEWGTELSERLPGQSRWGGEGGGEGGGGAPLVTDVGRALRGLGRSPVYTLAALASLVVGLGVNVGVFSVINGVLLRGLPYDDSDRLVYVWNEFASGQTHLPFSAPSVVAMREREVFEDLGALWARSDVLLRDEGALPVAVTLVSPGLLEMLGVHPQRGATPVERESIDGAPAEILITHHAWVDWLGSDADVVGQSVRLGGRSAQIVGVLPEDFKFHLPPDAGVPAETDIVALFPWRLEDLPANQHFLRVVGKRRVGVDLGSLQSALEVVATDVRSNYPDLAITGDHFTVVSLPAEVAGASRPALLALLGGVALFLLLSLANTGSLVLTRVTDRGRLIGLRAMLGASRLRAARQEWLESLLLATVSGVLATVLGVTVARALWRVRPSGLSTLDQVPLDRTVMLYAGVVTLCAVAAAAGATALGVRSALVGDLFGRGRSPSAAGVRRSHDAIATAAVATAMTLSVATALLTTSLRHQLTADLGFRADLTSVDVSLPLGVFPSDAERGRLVREVEASLRAQPGVRSVGATSHLPLATWANWSQASAPEEAAGERESGVFYDHRAVSDGYFATAGMRLLRGRTFLPSDDLESEAVVVVDSTFAARAFPGRDPLDSNIVTNFYRSGDFVQVVARVVGVSDDARDRGPRTPSTGQVFVPYAQSPRWVMSFVIDVEPGATLEASTVAGAVAAVDSRLAAARSTRVTDHLAEVTAESRFLSLVARWLSGVATLLAGVGLYAVVAYGASRRRREVGVRMALGASGQRVASEVLRRALGLGVVGIAVGALFAGATGFAIRGFLFGVGPVTPGPTLLLGMAFLGVVIVAAAVPALRSARVDPAELLREGV